MIFRYLISALFGLLALPACAEIVVQLKAFAETQSRQVRLSDIAALHSDSQAAVLDGLGRTLIVTIAHLNQPVRINAQQVARLIARQQPALRNQVRLEGASAVTVVLPGNTLPSEQVVEAAKSFLQQELQKMPYRFELRDAHLSAKPILLPAGALQLKPRFFGSFKPAAQIQVAVDILVNDRRIDSIRIGVDVDMYVPAYKLTRSMAAGQALESMDYKLVEQQVDGLTRGASLFDTKTDLSAHRLRRELAADAVLYRDDVEPIPYVSRNQNVLAELKSSGILIEKTVVAKTDGQLGQIIQVADTKSKASYSAKVIAYGRVEVK